MNKYSLAATVLWMVWGCYALPFKTAKGDEMKNLESYGSLIVPEKKEIRGAVIFYPPATGEKGQQRSEAERLSKLGIASFLYLPPYARKNNTGGFKNVPGEVELWREAKAEYGNLLKLLKDHFKNDSLQIAIVGKNLGGSVAAYSQDKNVTCAIVTGSVPLLSEFWVKSSHPVAVESRNGVTQSELEHFQKETSRFDLIHTVKEIPSKVLFQFGTQDPWIEKNQATRFEKSVSKETHKIEWIEDDHSMNSTQSIQNRIKFLNECFER